MSIIINQTNIIIVVVLVIIVVVVVIVAVVLQDTKSGIVNILDIFTWPVKNCRICL